RAQRQLAVRPPGVALLQDAGGDQRKQEHRRRLCRARRYRRQRFGCSLWHGHYKATEGGGEAQHQEGGWRRAQEEDDQQAAEEDPHRSREAGEQGEAAEAALGGAPDGFAVERGVHHVIVLLEREGGLRLELPRLVDQDLSRDPRPGLERRTVRGL